MASRESRKSLKIRRIEREWSGRQTSPEGSGVFTKQEAQGVPEVRAHFRYLKIPLRKSRYGG